MPTATNEARVFVSERPVITQDLPATIETSPITFCKGGRHVLSVQAIGQGLMYQWYRNGEPLPAADQSSYVAHSSGTYSVRVHTSCTANSVTSQSVEIEERVPPVVLFPPAHVTIHEGESFRLRFTLAEGSEPLTYQWYKNGVALSNITNAEFGVSTADANDAGDYEVRITNSCGATTTRLTTVKVIRNIQTDVPEVVAGEPLAVRCEPNPFTTSTQLHIDVASAGHLRVRITNVEGATIAVLHDAQTNGSLTLNLEASVLQSSGLYFMNVEFGGRSMVRPVVLTR